MADEYEKQFMGAGGEALFTDRVQNRRLPMLLAAGLLSAIGGAAMVVASTGDPLMALIPVGFATTWIGGLSLFFAFTRVSVTKEAVQIQLGTFGPKIPISAITSVEVVPGKGEFGVLSFVDGKTKNAVKICWAGGGRSGAVIVSTNDTAGMLDAIARARGGAPVMKTRVEIAEDASSQEEALEESRSKSARSAAAD